MYNSGNSSKNVTGASVVDGTLENADFADNGLSGDKIDGGIVSNFQSTGIDDRQTSGKVLYLDGTNVGISASSPDLSGFGSSSRGLEINNAQPTIRLKDTGGSSDDFYLVQAGADTYFYSKSNGKMRFNINGSERMRILPTGGITFNGDTAAANALDDYETGTFDVTLLCDGNSVTHSCSYTKIGNMVTVDFAYTGTSSTYWSIFGASGDAVTITSNLPFTPTVNGGFACNVTRSLANGNDLCVGWRAGSAGLYLGTADQNNYQPTNNATKDTTQSNITIQGSGSYVIA